jgi:hypothetical protein
VSDFSFYALIKFSDASVNTRSPLNFFFAGFHGKKDRHIELDRFASRGKAVPIALKGAGDMRFLKHALRTDHDILQMELVSGNAVSNSV